MIFRRAIVRGLTLVFALALLNAPAVAAKPVEHTPPRCTTLEACIDTLRTFHLEEDRVPAQASWVSEFYQVFKPYGRQGVEALLKLYYNSDWRVVRRADRVLNTWAFKAWPTDFLHAEDLGAIERGYWKGASGAPRLAGWIGTDAAYDFLIVALVHDPNVSSNAQVHFALAQGGDKILDRLMEVLRCRIGGSRNLARGVAAIFGEMDPKPARAIPLLTHLLTDPIGNSCTKIGAALSLRAYGVVAASAGPTLLQLLDATDEWVSKAAREALIGIRSPLIVPRLIADFERGKFDPWEFADLGKIAQAAGPVLLRRLENELKRLDEPLPPPTHGGTTSSWHVAETVGQLAVVLGAIGYDPAVPTLLQTTHSDDWYHVYASVWALGVLRSQTARDRLSEISQTHWFAAVRELSKIAIERPELLTDPTQNGRLGRPEPLWSASIRFPDTSIDREACDTGWVEIDGKRRALRNPALPSSRTRPFPPAPDKRPYEAALRVGNGWFLGTNYGEWGGALYYWEANTGFQLLLEDNISAIHLLNGQVIVTAGLAHLGANDGHLYSIVATSDGYRVKPTLRLPGTPRASEVANNRLLLVADFGAIAFDGQGVTELKCLP